MLPARRPFTPKIDNPKSRLFLFPQQTINLMLSAKNENLVKMYPDMDIFVREDGDSPESQILGLKTKERIHSLERYIQDLDFEDDLWKEIYQLGDQLQRRFLLKLIYSWTHTETYSLSSIKTI